MYNNETLTNIQNETNKAEKTVEKIENLQEEKEQNKIENQQLEKEQEENKEEAFVSLLLIHYNSFSLLFHIIFFHVLHVGLLYTFLFPFL